MKEIIERILKKVCEEGEASVEGFTKEMLQFSYEDIKGYLEEALTLKQAEFLKLDKLANKYAKMIELMADGMSYDKALKEVGI